MKTTVVNVNHGECDVWIGRHMARKTMDRYGLTNKYPLDDLRCPTHGLWANPFGKRDGPPQRCLDLFESLMRTRLGLPTQGNGICALRLMQAADPFHYPESLIPDADVNAWREALCLLIGMRLGCWCPPRPCHGDVLIRLIEIVEPIHRPLPLFDGVHT